MAMLDFILEFERVLKQWPEGTNWSITQIADYTGSSIPQVVDILSDVLNREIEVHENLSLQDAGHALKILRERMQHQLIARQRRIEAHREKIKVKLNLKNGSEMIRYATQWVLEDH